MNTPFNEYSAGDVARMLKVDKSTVAYWCKKGKIISKNISSGTHNARYLIPEQEVEYLRKLCKQYGKRGIMQHYEKVGENLENISKINMDDATFLEPAVDAIIESETPSSETPSAEESEVKADNLPARPAKFDVDEIALKIAEIQDIRERLENLEAEKNQLTHELEDLRKSVLAYI